MPQYAVYHMEKGNTSSGGIGNHIDRKKGAEHTYQHADKDKLHLNQNFDLNKYCSMPLNKAIEERIKEGYKGQKAIRKDAVKYTTHILTGSHEKMKEIESNPKQLENWIIENKKFLEREFGKENIVRFAIHRDEKTPHLHAVTVNLTADGRLSAKEIIGNKKDMQNRQDRYAQAMQSFGLERGLKSTGVKHENAREYYARMEQAKEVGDLKAIKVDKNFLGVYKEESVKNIEQIVKAQTTALKTKEIEIEKLKSRFEDVAESKNMIVQNVKEQTKMLDRILMNDELKEQLKEERTKQIGQKYWYDVKIKINTHHSSFHQNTNEQIHEKVFKASVEVGKEKGLTSAQTRMLMTSKEVYNVAEELIKERDRKNDLDQSRDRGIGR